MAKAKAEEKDTTTAVATVKGTTAVALQLDDLDALAGDSGAGRENVSSTDMQTPLLVILQSNSPQCKRSDPAYIDGAREGMFYENVTGRLFDGDAGITVVPCHFEKVFMEWRPKRGGLVAIHGADTPLRNQVEMKADSENPDKLVPTLPNGNQLTETNQHYALIVNDDGTTTPVVIPMSSSKLGNSRRWNTLQGQVTLTDSKGRQFVPATWFMKYTLKTMVRTKDKDSWYVFDISPAGPTITPEDRSLYELGKQFNAAIKGGTVKVKHEDLSGGTDDGEPARDDDMEDVPL